MSKLDPRVVRTRHMLREALVALITERGYDQITIQDVTDRAGLRRATFYLHYKDKEELLLTMLQDIFNDLESKIEPLIHQSMTYESEYTYFLSVFNHAQQYADLYRAVLQGSKASLILRYVHDYLVQDIHKHYQNGLLPGMNLNIPMDVLSNYMAAMKVNMGVWWLQAGMPYPPEVIAAMCARLTINGVTDAVVGWEHTQVSD